MASGRVYTAFRALCDTYRPHHPDASRYSFPRGRVVGNRDMLRATLRRWKKSITDARSFVLNHRDRDDQAAIAQVDDPRIEAVLVEDHGPTTKADCLNRL